MLLELDFQSVQAGDVHPGAGVLQLFHPGPGERIFLAVLDVLFHGPPELRQFVAVQELPGFRQGNFIVVGKALIPGGELPLDLGFRRSELFIQVFDVGIGLVEQRVLHVLHAPGPIVPVSPKITRCHRHHRRPHSPGRRSPRSPAGWQGKRPGTDLP